MYTKLITERLSWISCLISIICILYIVLINHEIAVRYLEADGKTRALFFVEFSFNYKYYVLLPAFLALASGIVSFRREQLKTRPVISIVLACLTIVLVVLRIWRLMI